MLTRLIKVVITTLALVFYFASQANAQSHTKTQVQRVSYVDRGNGLDSRNAYKFELIELVMKVTQDIYGDYIIKPYNKDPGAYRLSLMMSEGEKVNILWASPGTVISKAKVIPIEFDILEGMQGYRVCIISRFSTIPSDQLNTVEDLRKIKIAQGIGWVELEIYQHNNIPVLTSPNYEGLFDMVSSNRADCVPIGSNEASSVIARANNQNGNLAIESSLLIYYPYPMNFYVSKNDPVLAARIKDGLERLKNSSELNKLFNKHFGQDLAILKIENRKVICLKSPFTTAGVNCDNPQSILENYQKIKNLTLP